MTKEMGIHNGMDRFPIRPRSEPAIISISTDIPELIKPPKMKVKNYQKIVF